jgi:hypothetical protein
MRVCRGTVILCLAWAGACGQSGGAAGDGSAGGTGGGEGGIGGNIDGGPMILTVDAGMPTRLAMGEAGGPSAIAVDATHVYWTDAKAKTLMKVPKQGGAPVTLASGQDGISALAIDAANVYWVNNLTGDLGSVMKVALGGGTPIPIATQQYAPNSVAVDAMHVYWTTAGNYVSNPAGTVMKASLANGEVAALSSSQWYPGGIVVDATRVYWATGSGEGGGGGVVNLPLAGGTPAEVVFVVPPSSIAGLSAVDTSSIYWLEYGPVTAAGPGPPSLKKKAIAGGDAITLVVGKLGRAVVEGGSLYMAVSRDRAIMRISVDGATTALVPIDEQPVGLVLDQTQIFFTTAEGSVMAMARP